MKRSFFSRYLSTRNEVMKSQNHYKLSSKQCDARLKWSNSHDFWKSEFEGLEILFLNLKNLHQPGATEFKKLLKKATVLTHFFVLLTLPPRLSQPCHRHRRKQTTWSGGSSWGADKYRTLYRPYNFSIIFRGAAEAWLLLWSPVNTNNISVLENCTQRMLHNFQILTWL